MMMDLMMIETGSGGDLVYDGSDIVMATGAENQPYLGMFGGDDDYWANDLLLNDEPDNNNVFTSTTEQTLRTTALTSSGRLVIEAAMANDLQFISDGWPGTKITVSSSIPSPDRMEATIDMNGQRIAMEWNPSKEALNYKI